MLGLGLPSAGHAARGPLPAPLLPARQRPWDAAPLFFSVGGVFGWEFRACG